MTKVGWMTISPEQSRAARALLNWSQTDLASAAKVARATLADFEAGKRTPYPRTLDDMRAALEKAGVIFIEANGDGPGVRLRKRRRRPQSIPVDELTAENDE